MFLWCRSLRAHPATARGRPLPLRGLSPRRRRPIRGLAHPASRLHRVPQGHPCFARVLAGRDARVLQGLRHPALLQARRCRLRRRDPREPRRPEPVRAVSDGIRRAQAQLGVSNLERRATRPGPLKEGVAFCRFTARCRRSLQCSPLLSLAGSWIPRFVQRSARWLPWQRASWWPQWRSSSPSGSSRAFAVARSYRSSTPNPPSSRLPSRQSSLVESGIENRPLA